MAKEGVEIVQVEYLRLDRLLSNMSCGSRNQVKQMIKSGRVAVDGHISRDPGLRVRIYEERVELDGKQIVYHPYIYLMLNKPAGVISATEDRGQSTVLDLLEPKYLNKGIFPVGRLDKDTEGLLLLTNHGELGHQLLSPKKHVSKKYFVKVEGWVTSEDQQAFRDGIVLDDGYRTLPGELEILWAGEVSEVNVMICEGKFHQIKRMFQSLGKTVLYLKRFAMGPLLLDENLPCGQYRELDAAELTRLSENFSQLENIQKTANPNSEMD